MTTEAGHRRRAYGGTRPHRLPKHHIALEEIAALPQLEVDTDTDSEFHQNAELQRGYRTECRDLAEARASFCWFLEKVYNPNRPPELLYKRLIPTFGLRSNDSFLTPIGGRIHREAPSRSSSAT